VRAGGRVPCGGSPLTPPHTIRGFVWIFGSGTHIFQFFQLGSSVSFYPSARSGQSGVFWRTFGRDIGFILFLYQPYSPCPAPHPAHFPSDLLPRREPRGIFFRSLSANYLATWLFVCLPFFAIRGPTSISITWCLWVPSTSAHYMVYFHTLVLDFLSHSIVKWGRLAYCARPSLHGPSGSHPGGLIVTMSFTCTTRDPLPPPLPY